MEADEGQINQVINNLLINADQAMPSGGIIKIGAGNIVVEEGSDLPLPGGKYVKLTIVDQGIGIANEYLDKIFDPYFTTKQKGSGLGLATTYSIIKNHYGHIKVESQFGVGTTFELFLPAIEAEALGAHEEPATPIIGQGKILVMDDDEKIRETLGRMLEPVGLRGGFCQRWISGPRKVRQGERIWAAICCGNPGSNRSRRHGRQRNHRKTSQNRSSSKSHSFQRLFG